MTTGMVKWFNARTSFGFTRSDDNNGDVVVKVSAVERPDNLQDDQTLGLAFETNRRTGTSSAAPLKVL